MRKAIIVISGFTEDNYEETGSRKLWSKLLPYHSMTEHNEFVFVTLKPWDYDWKDFGLWLNSLNVSECFVCAYSWGAGFGRRKFSKSFLGSITCVLCDPVYRSKFPWMRWLAFLDKTIKYPRNVTIKKWFYQKLDEPGGDKVQGAPKGIKLNAVHTEIDDHPAYHDAAINEINKWLQAPQQ